MIDVVIVSDAKTKDFRLMTQMAVDTAIADGGVTCYVVEAQEGVEYRDAVTLHYTFPFNYNRCLNFGAAKGSGDYIAFCNNDLVFEYGWTGITETMKQQRAMSASPLCPKTGKDYGHRVGQLPKQGYSIRNLFCGWCFVWTRKLWELYPHDEDRRFWTADNASAATIRKAGVKHVLDSRHMVYHIQSATLQSMTSDERDLMTWGEVKNFNKKYKQNLFNLGT